ncbi:MAG: hypothetical protein GY950_12540, partial [bacterium]|nr:hypothetical protein [bacterium]
MALFELDDVFTYQDANDIKRMWAGTADPDTATADEGEIYLNTGSTPYQFKRFNGTVWEVIGQMTAQEILDAVKTVHGAGSGLDADTLDGAQPSAVASNDTIVQRNASGYVFANYFNTTSGNSTTPTHIYGSQDDFIRKVTPSQLVTFVSSADGAGSGLDADKVDGLESSQFIRSDANDNVSAHTEWQDTYQVRLGNSADLRLQHTGTVSYIDNYTGHLYIRQLS